MVTILKTFFTTLIIAVMFYHCPATSAYNIKEPPSGKHDKITADTFHIKGMLVILNHHVKTDNYAITMFADTPKDLTLRFYYKGKKIMAHEQTKSVTKFKKLYTLSYLPKGNYCIQISDGENVVVKKIKLRGKELLHPNEGKSFLVDFTPVPQSKEMDVYVQNLSFEEAYITVYDNNKNVLNKQSLGVETMTIHTLALAQLQPGQYLIKVENGLATYEKTITL